MSTESPRTRLLDEEAAAKYLGIPRIRLAKWRQARRIAYFKPTNKTVLYDVTDLEALIQATRVEATAPAPKPRNKPKTPEHRANISAGRKRYWDRVRAEQAARS